MLHLPKMATISLCVCPTNKKEQTPPQKCPWQLTWTRNKTRVYSCCLSNCTWRIGGNLRLGINGSEVPKDATQSSFLFNIASNRGVLLEFLNNTPDKDAGGFSKSRSSFATEFTVWLESSGYRCREKCANFTSPCPWAIISVTAMESHMNALLLFDLLSKQGNAVFAWYILSWMIVRCFSNLEIDMYRAL
jgi:hypothetical protein